MFSQTERYFYDHQAIKEANGRNRRTVWSIPTQAFKGAHFATFPPALVESGILASSREGDFVLDQFFGLGTVGAVCEALGRRYVGIELNPDYVRIAAERLHTMLAPPAKLARMAKQ